MLIIVGIISISNYMKSMFNTKFRLTMNKKFKIKIIRAYDIFRVWRLYPI